MSLLHANREGVLIQILLTPEEIALYDQPEETAYTLALDPDTNAALLRHINQHIDSYRLIGDLLTLAGEPVTIQPASATTQQLNTLRADNRTNLDETAFSDASDDLRRLAHKVAWLEREWRHLKERRSSNNLQPANLRN